MAIVRAGHYALDMRDLGFAREATENYSDQSIRRVYGSSSYTDIYGDFEYGPDRQISGTVDFMQNATNNHLAWSISGFVLSAEQLFSYIHAGDILGAEGYIFGGADTIRGTSFNDHLLGFGGNDVIKGNDGDDVLIGGDGADKIYGGADADTVTYLSQADSGTRPATRDTIVGFSHADGDTIDLSAIDANVHTRHSNEAFTLVEHFSGSASELIVQQVGAAWLVQADTDGGGSADFTIMVRADGPLIASDFVM